MAELNVFESSPQNVKKFLLCLDLLTQKFLTCILIWNEIYLFRHNNHNQRLILVSNLIGVGYSLLNIGLFSLKFELLSLILFHSGIQFDLLFNFTQSMTKSNWSFEDFWLTCFDYCAAIVDKVVAKNKRKIDDPWTEKWPVFLRKETD